MNYMHAIFVAVLFVFGCGGVPKGARETLAVSARSLLVIDGAVATRYTAAADAALQEAETLPDYRARMVDWDATAEAIRTAKVALLTAEQALDVWDDTGNGASFKEAAKSLAVALGNVADALRTVGVTLPESLDTALSLARAWGGTER